MSNVQIGVATTTFVLFAFCWLFYFAPDIRRWWRERGPRRQLAREAVREREAELTRLRDELASKYLPQQAGTPPAADR